MPQHSLETSRASHRSWTAIPTQRSSASVLRVKLATVLTISLIAMVSGPIGLVIALSHKTPAPVAPSIQASPTTAAAQIVAQDFLAGRPTLIPVAQGSTDASSDVTSNFSFQSVGEAHGSFAYQDLAFAGAVDRQDNATSYQLDSFFVETSTGLYTLSVPMLETATGPVLGGLPSLSATPLASGASVDPLTYPTDSGYVAGNSAYPAYASYIQSAVSSWAQAYASDDQAGLQAVAKYAQQPTYPALGGFVASNATIESEVASTTGLYVRVIVALTKGHFTTLSEYDLLLSNADSANPSVVSWGAAGSVPLSNF